MKTNKRIETVLLVWYLRHSVFEKEIEISGNKKNGNLVFYANI